MTPPVAGTNHAGRQVALPPASDLGSDLWTEVHGEVQKQLAGLESEVRRRLPQVHVQKARTQGERFYLFSYRTFSIPDSGLDAVVAGITFTPADQGVTLDADVSGEQTGDCLYSLPRHTVPHSSEELHAAAGGAAQKLCPSAEAIAAALQDPSRRLE
jgi:hypothetical protein